VAWLERWDRRNQRTLEWHQHLYEQERRGVTPSPSRWLLVALGAWAVVTLLRLFADDPLGVWMGGILFAIWVGCLVLMIRDQRRKRAAWEAGRARDWEDATG
jgi:Flp pilus assembly protein TadB